MARLARFPIRWVMWIVLLGQVALAGALIAEDVGLWWGSFGRAAPAFEPTAPVAPGDQLRPYNPGRLPARPEDAGAAPPPAIRLRTGGAQLSFRRVETEAHGLVLMLEGGIAPGDSDRFERALDEGAAPDVIGLNSPGGSVVEALRIGMLTRGAKLGTLVSAEAACISACPLILFAGVERIVSRRGWVGMHQAYLSPGTIIPSARAVRDVQTVQGLILEHVIEMGIDPTVLTHALTTPPDKAYFLVEDELTFYGAATRMVD